MVGEALMDSGVKVFIRTPQELLEESMLSIAQEKDNNNSNINFMNFNIHDLQVIWLRRPRYFFSRNNAIGISEHIKWNQETLFLGIIYKLLEVGKYVIHNYLQNAFVKNKYFQLVHAKRLGFRIPGTYYICNKNLLNTLKNKNSGQNWLIKPATELVFEDENKILRYGSASVLMCDIQDEIDIPLLVQNKIIIKKEIKCVYINRQIFAVEISVSYDYEDLNDVPYADRTYKAIEVPSDIKEKCISLCEQLGLVLVTIDFIINQEGEWVFIEMNENGQFLFVEELCPELPILHTTVKFFLKNIDIEKYLSIQKQLAFEDYRTRTKEHLLARAQRKE